MEVHHEKSIRLFTCAATIVAVVSLGLAGCDSSGSNTASLSPGTITPAGPGPVPVAPPPTPTAPARSWSTDAMVFTGDGTWASEITSIETILTSYGASYQEANSAQVNAMSLSQLESYGTFIFPGGTGSTEADSLTSTTHANLREAVQVGGVGYVGFCAGAFIAEAPAPAAGGDVSYGIGVVNGPLLGYYEAENQGVDFEMTLESFPNGTTEDLLWYGGPVTPNVTGGVIARYPTGEPAITQVKSGNGFVVMSGVHPTADQAILTALGMTSTDGTHTDTAWKLLNAALNQTPLQAF